MPQPPFVIQRVDPSAMNEANTNAQAAYLTNLQYRMVNNPETLTASERAYAKNEEELRDARAESLKHKIAFSQPRNDLDAPRSARFQQLQQEYGMQRYSTIGGYTPVRHPEVTISPTRFEDSAAGIAQQLALSGGRVGPSVASTARSEGFSGNLNVSEFSGRATVPIRGERTELSNYEKELVGYSTRQLSGALEVGGKIQDMVSKENAYLSKTPFKSTIASPVAPPQDDIFSSMSRTISGGIDGIFGGFRDTGANLYKGVVLPGAMASRTAQQTAVALQMDTMGKSRGGGIDYAAIANVAKFMNRPDGGASQGTDIFGFRSAGAAAGQAAVGIPAVKYYNNPKYSEDIGLSATFVGRGVAPAFSPIKGSVTERFAFDEYGKVLANGQKFEPAYSNAGIPYNPKMGAGEYVYVGEYQYQGGERVSRYVEKNVGSYVDFGQSGMAFRKEVNIRGGGSPGAYYATAQQVDVPTGSAVKGTQGFDIFGTVRGAVDFGYNLPSYAVARGNEMFSQIPVLSQINLAGREAGLGMEISQKNEYLFAKTKGYEEAGLIRGGAFAGSQEQYADLVATQNRIGVLQGEQGRIRGELTGNVGEAMLFTKPVYDMAHGASVWWGDNVGKTYEKTISPLTGPVGSGVERFLNDNRGSIAAVGMLPVIGAPFKMMASENPLMLNAPSKVSEASTALVGVPGQMLEFGGMAVVGGEIAFFRNPVAIPALAMSGLIMQGQGIEEGIRTRPTGFFYEQLGMMAASEVAIRGVQKASPVGFGVAEIPTFDPAVANRYYMAYTKMPFSANARGGTSLFTVGRMNIPIEESLVTVRTGALKTTPGDFTFETKIKTFGSQTDAQRVFGRVAESGEQTFYHATGDIGFVNTLLESGAVKVATAREGALFFGPPGEVYSQFFKGFEKSVSKESPIGGALLRMKGTPLINEQFIRAAERVGSGAKMGQVAPELSPGLYPGLRAFSGTPWKSVGLEHEYIVPTGSKFYVTDVTWMSHNGKSIPIIDVSMGAPGAAKSFFTRVGYETTTRASMFFKTGTKATFGSPVKLAEKTRLEMETISPYSVEAEWNRAQYITMEGVIQKFGAPTEAGLWATTQKAIDAAQSGLYKPVQKELLGEYPIPSASRQTMGKLFTSWSDFGAESVIGGSRTIRAWVGSSGRGASLADVDIWVKQKHLSGMYEDSLAIVKQEYPNPQASIVEGEQFNIATINEKFLGAHTIEQFPHVMQDLVKMKTVGGGEVYVPSPAASFRMKASGIFSKIRYSPETGVEFTINRAKDIADGYSLSRTIATSLYEQTPIIDVAGAITSAKVGRAQLLESWSGYIKEYAKGLPEPIRGEVSGMFGEMRTDALWGVERFPSPQVDIVTGKGWLDRPTRGWNEEAVLFPGRHGRRIEGFARVSESDIKMLSDVRSGKIRVEQAKVESPEGKLLDIGSGTDRSTSSFTDAFAEKYGGKVVKGQGIEMTDEFDAFIGKTSMVHSHPSSVIFLDQLFSKKGISTSDFEPSTIKMIVEKGVEDFTMLPSVADVRGSRLFSPAQEGIIHEKGMTLFDFPKNSRFDTFELRMTQAEFMEKSMRMEESFQVPIIEQILADELVTNIGGRKMFESLSPELQAAEHIGVSHRAGVIAFAKFAEMENIGVEFVTDIDMKTGIGRTTGFPSYVKEFFTRHPEFGNTGEVRKLNVPKEFMSESLFDTSTAKNMWTPKKGWIQDKSYPMPTSKQTRGYREPLTNSIASGRLIKYPFAATGFGSLYSTAGYTSGNVKMVAKPFYPQKMQGVEKAYSYPTGGNKISKYPASAFKYPSTRFIKEMAYPYPKQGSATARYPTTRFTRQANYPAQMVPRAMYPDVTFSRSVYPTTATSRSMYPTTTTSRSVYPAAQYRPFYPTGITGGGRDYIPTMFTNRLMTTTTYIKPGMEKEIRRKKRKARKSEEWYIWNSVALFNSVFGDVQETWPGQFPLKSSELDFSKRQRKPKFIGPYKQGPTPW